MIFKLEKLHWKKKKSNKPVLFSFPNLLWPPKKLAKSPEMLSAQLNEPKINFCQIRQNSLGF